MNETQINKQELFAAKSELAGNIKMMQFLQETISKYTNKELIYRVTRINFKFFLSVLNIRQNSLLDKIKKYEKLLSDSTK